ncbi:hypothetical protein [Motilimonas sp. KMU-193]|uniref:hypothetical protein n=1 Tax=Motilimonas sp. KMU-193 TaxID=3388668 RepID=UPI00396B21B2
MNSKLKLLAFTVACFATNAQAQVFKQFGDYSATAIEQRNGVVEKQASVALQGSRLQLDFNANSNTKGVMALVDGEDVQLIVDGEVMDNQLDDSEVLKVKNAQNMAIVYQSKTYPVSTKGSGASMIFITDFSDSGKKVPANALDYRIEQSQFVTSQGVIPAGCFGQLKTDLNGDNTVATIYINRNTLRGCIAANFPFPGGDEAKISYKIVSEGKPNQFNIEVCERVDGSLGASCDNIIIEFVNRPYITPSKTLSVLSIEKIGEW